MIICALGPGYGHAPGLAIPLRGKYQNRASKEKKIERLRMSGSGTCRQTFKCDAADAFDDVIEH